MSKNEMSPARLRSQHRVVRTRQRPATLAESVLAQLPKSRREEKVRLNANRRCARHIFAVEAMHRAAMVRPVHQPA